MNVGLTTEILLAGEAATEAATRALAEGGLVAFPTETVYGLGADATNALARAQRTSNVTSCPANAIRPPKYPPTAPAPTTRIRIVIPRDWRRLARRYAADVKSLL